MATLSGSAANDTLTGTTGIDLLDGGSGNDSLSGGAGADLLIGGAGRDLLNGGTGADRMIGGYGNDTYMVDDPNDVITELSGGGRDLVRSTIALSLSIDWANEIEDLLYLGTAAASLEGNDLDNMILSQGAGADSLYGGLGNDTLGGGGGTDLLAGGEGDDLYLVDGSDIVSEIADEGRDTFKGTRTSIALGPYATTIENLIYTGTVAAILSGNAMDNVIVGGTGANTIVGGIGNDSLAGGTGIDVLQGGEGNDHLFGGNIRYLTIGSDRINDTSADRLIGGTGNDIYYLNDTLDTVTEDLAGGTADVIVSTVSNSLSRYANIEALVLDNYSTARSATGSDRDDLLVGNRYDNVISGGIGNDTLSGWGLSAGSGAADVLSGGVGNDVLLAYGFAAGVTGIGQVTMDGGSGNDLYVVGADVQAAGWDSGGTDSAVLFGSAGAAGLSGVENFYLYGVQATASLRARDAIVAAYAAMSGGAEFDTDTLLQGQNVTGNDLANRIFGNALDNVLSGGAGNDSISGGLGADTLIGGSGTDNLSGGSGNDVYIVASGDSVIELATQGGFDTVRSSTLSVAQLTSFANVEAFFYTGTSSINLQLAVGNITQDMLGGGSGNDTIDGYGGNDTLFGGGGQDTMIGDDGRDLVNGDTGNDVLAGGAGDDTLYGGTGHDTLDGQANFDLLVGGSGNDLLLGGDGNDILQGGSGNDTLDGQSGSDQIIGGAGDDVINFGSSSFGKGDILYGDDQSLLSAYGLDVFACTLVTTESAISETFTGSGIFEWAHATLIADFQAGTDQIGILANFVGNFDLTLDGFSEVSAGATFSATDEIVFFRDDTASPFLQPPSLQFDGLLAADVQSIITTASASFAVNETRIFVVDDGANSAIFLFQSTDGNDSVSADELYLLALVANENALEFGDFVLF